MDPRPHSHTRCHTHCHTDRQREDAHALLRIVTPTTAFDVYFLTDNRDQDIAFNSTLLSQYWSSGTIQWRFGAKRTKNEQQ